MKKEELYFFGYFMEEVFFFDLDGSFDKISKNMPLD